ncbi:MAG: DUF2177 family protein [Bauldia sp.]|nr:DUF2177 family protein [Bauldia sp.]
MTYLTAYVVSLVVFLGVDFLWLSTMGAALYRSTLGDLLASSVRLAPAAVFYLVYPIGIVVFAVSPALTADSWMRSAALGALFGALAYATYDLTNFATLRTWSLQITVLDIAYGAIASGAAAVVAYFVVKAIFG